MSAESRRKWWVVAEIGLWAIWMVAALITMYPHVGKELHLSGGFFSSYAADLTFPPWYYIVLRRRPSAQIPVVRWFGSSPEVAASSIFVVGVITEVSQIYWPKGIFRGTFDPFDIAAYAVGLVICYVAEKREMRGVRSLAVAAR